MNFKKLKQIVASAVVLSSFLCTTIAQAATVGNTSSSDITQTSISIGNTSTADENVLKVNVDDSGEVTYTVPVSNNGLEDKPFTWDNATVYFVMTDRFVNGDTSNDHSYNRGLDANGRPISGYQNKEGYFHGGDLKGLTSKINDGYFTDLGVNAIWITAPYEQIHGALTGGADSPGRGFKHYGYHGYYALDFTEVDKNMGTEQDLRNFIDTAHSYGIRVIFDIVLNHAGYANPYDANEFGYGGLASNWKDIYYNMDEKQYSWWNDYVDIAAGKGGQGMMLKNADWETNWWGSKWVRMTEGRYSYANLAPESSGVETCLDGLPDFVTEGKTDPGMPSILKKKWSSSKLAQEERELNEFCQNYGLSKNVNTYLVKWLTDWVREYGVDGFRCDTAKHVNQTEWGVLKKAGVQALKEWRSNNPDKPGADWTDDFWMTGEAWDWNIGYGYDGYFRTGGFDSMINFSFQGIAGTSGSALEGIFSNYASKINNTENFNVLNYISSHDTALYNRAGLINAANSLLLSPGAAQIYYGDETARNGDGTTGMQPTRSNMNWDSINKNVLSHWQKIGKFRDNHLAIGAGAHKQLSTSPYTFSRVYEKKGISDKVVVSIPGKSGATTVKVTGVFEDGQGVRDAYTGKEYVVSGGEVSVTAGDNGVVLLEMFGEAKPTVSVSPASTKYYENTLTVTLSSTEGVAGKYSINGGAAKSFTNGQTITIGAGETVGSVTTITVTGVDANGNQLESKTATYTKDIIVFNEGTIYSYPQSGWGTTMYAYVYDESTGTASSISKWPGVAMTYNEQAGRYELELDKKWQNPKTQVIFTDGNNQVPATRLPGEYYKEDKVMVFNEAGKIEFKDPTTIIIPPVDPIVVGEISTNVPSPQYEGTSINISTTAATGGKGGFTYQFEVDGEVIKSYSSTMQATWKPTTEGTYTIKVTSKDSEGNTSFTTKSFTIKKKEIIDPIEFKFTSTSTSPSSPVNAGSTVKLGALASGGKGTIEYRIVVLKNGVNVFTKGYSETNFANWTPKSGGNYVIHFKAKDGTGAEISTTRNFVVDETVNLAITKATTSLVSPQEVGTAIKLSATATGQGTIKYRFVARKDNTNVFTRAYSTSNSTTWTPKSAGKYTLYFKAKDASGKEVTKTIQYEIKAKEGITLDSITTDKISPQLAGSSIKITAKATSESSVQYKFWAYNPEGEWKLLKNFSSSNTVTWTPVEGGNYTIWVDAKDSKGNITSKQISYQIKDKLTRVEQNNSKITYTGKWTAKTGADFSKNGIRLTDTLGSKATFKFTGTGIKILATADKDRGVAKVTIDGVVYAADMYASKTEFQSEVLKVTGLTNKTHTITIEYTGLNSGNSNGTIIEIDAFDIIGGDII